MGRGLGLIEADEVDAERLGVGGFTVMLDMPLLELVNELMRPSSLLIVNSHTSAGCRQLD
jgi:hypothetical protein